MHTVDLGTWLHNYQHITADADHRRPISAMKVFETYSERDPDG